MNLWQLFSFLFECNRQILVLMLQKKAGILRSLFQSYNSNDLGDDSLMCLFFMNSCIFRHLWIKGKVLVFKECRNQLRASCSHSSFHLSSISPIFWIVLSYYNSTLSYLTFTGIAICWMIWHLICWRLMVLLMRNCSSIFSYVDVKHISRRGWVFFGYTSNFLAALTST